MNVWVKRTFAYLLSLSCITVVFIYVLDIPTFISQAPDLVNEYYYKNAISSFILDVFLIAFYISAAMYAGKFLRLSQKDHAQQLLAVVMTTTLVSSLFMLYFLSFGEPKAFFTRWFDRVRYKAVLYDVVLVSSVYVMMIKIYNYILYV